MSILLKIPESADFVVSTILDEKTDSVKDIFSLTITIDRNGREELELGDVVVSKEVEYNEMKKEIS